MSYNDLIGLFHEPTEKQTKILEERRIKSDNTEHDYDRVRYGLPHGAIKHEEVINEVNLLVDYYFKHGYERWPAPNLSPRFRKHVALFRASLDLYVEFSKDQVFSRDEIYVRCLREGPAFAEFIKKCRATCLRAKTSETQTEVEEEYYFDNYTGYNSIIDERYLIHWDDRDDVDDVKYCFIPQERNRDKQFSKYLDEFWEDFGLDDTDWVTEFDMIGAIKNTKMYDPISKKTMLMRDFWDSSIDPNAPYYAKRSVVLTHPGSTRDTGVGDPSTILKVKQLNALARCISERVPYCANAPGPVCNARLKRVLKKNAFLHLDFKKFGLTFPRRMLNILIRKISKSSGINLDHLIINEFTIEIDGEAYKTERGTVLGWLDSINSICVAIILHHLSKKCDLKFDFVTFNDDVEISKRVASAIPETLELLRCAIVTELDSFDIPISMKKTYGSKASVFLERYAYYQKEYGLDMYKEQLTVAAYAKSLVTEFPWQAKLYFSAAEQWTKSDYATDRCINTCPVEFRKDENTLPLWAGGWFIRRSNGLDLGMEDTDRLGLRLGIELSKFKSPRYATKREKPSSNSEIREKVNAMSFHAYSSEMGRTIFDMKETRRDLNVDLELIFHSVETLCDIFSGHNKLFSENVARMVSSHREAFYDAG